MGQIRGWAFGLLGMTREEFYLMRLGEFWEALQAHRQEKEEDRMHIGELVRGAVLRLYNSERQPSHQILNPSKFWRMPWDDPEEAEDNEIKRLTSLSDEDRKAEIEKFLKRIHGEQQSKPEG